MKRKTPVANMSMNESSYQRSKEESAIGKYLNNSMDDDDSDDEKEMPWDYGKHG